MEEKNKLGKEYQSCAVIRDLLPSYLEEICSDESDRLVENHLAECAECRELAEKLKTTEFEKEDADRLTFDYMKKVKRHTRNREMGGFILLIGFLAFSMLLIMGLQGKIAFSVYFATMPLIMLISYVLLLDYVPAFLPIARKGEGKGKIPWLAFIEAIVFIYSVGLQGMADQWMLSGKYPFGMEAYDIGPFVYRQSFFLILIQLLLFLVLMVQSVHRNVSHLILQNLCMLGSYVNLIYISLLRRMTTVEAYMTVRNRAYLILVSEWVAAVLIFCLLEWRRGKKYE